MKLLDFFRIKRNNTSASVAKERLKVIVSHERAKNQDPEFLKKLHAEIMEVIKKYVHIEPGQVNVNIDKDNDCSVLELNVTLNDTKSPTTKAQPA
jgi:cell division topological specificity factor